ncbi:hypothetical protein D3C71_1967620 [compost metagenome]
MQQLDAQARLERVQMFGGHGRRQAQGPARGREAGKAGRLDEHPHAGKTIKH